VAKKRSLDAIDVGILEALQMDAGMTNQAIGEKVGLTPGPTHSRIKRLKEEGYIKGTHADLNWHALGMEFFSSIDVKVPVSKADEAQHWLRQVPGIWNLAKMKNTGNDGEVIFRFWGVSSDRYVSLAIIDSILKEFDSSVDIQIQEMELIERRSSHVRLGRTVLGDGTPIWTPAESPLPPTD
jgi:DNA-binding Lrp family transcriptional regulator